MSQQLHLFLLLLSFESLEDFTGVLDQRQESALPEVQSKVSTWLSFHSGERIYYKNNIQIIFKIASIKEYGTKADFSRTVVTSGQKHFRLNGLRSTPSSHCHLQERDLRGAAGQRRQGRTYCI